METENRMNIVAINRVDPYIKSILGSSTHVAFYTFNSDKNGKFLSQKFILKNFNALFCFRMGKN